jgi:hypothetical protein
MDLDKHLPTLDRDLRAALTAMTAPDPAERPQRARDVVKLLGKPGRSVRDPDKSIEKAGRRELADRRPPPKLFADVQEPVGALLRLAVLGFSAGGWFAMLWIRFAVFVTVTIAALIAFPSRRQIRGVGKDVDHLLTDGQQGFAELARRSIARDRAELPPGDR